MPDFKVELPGGGELHLQSVEEQNLWESTNERYQEEYTLEKPNDLVLLGVILSQQISLFRAQQRLNGMEAALDNNGVPTGSYNRVEVKPADMAKYQKMIQIAATEMRELEKTLGIDKKTREAGGQHTVATYLTELKLAANQYGVHISRRVKEYEQFVMDLRWRLRLLKNGDEEDRAYHGISEEKVLEWAEGRLLELEEIDKKFATERGKVWVGRL